MTVCRTQLVTAPATEPADPTKIALEGADRALFQQQVLTSAQVPTVKWYDINGTLITTMRLIAVGLATVSSDPVTVPVPPEAMSLKIFDGSSATASTWAVCWYRDN